MTYCFSLENVAYAVLQTKRHQNRKEKVHQFYKSRKIQDMNLKLPLNGLK